MEHPSEHAQTHRLSFPSCSYCWGELYLFIAPFLLLLSCSPACSPALIDCACLVWLEMSGVGLLAGWELAQTPGREAGWDTEGVRVVSGQTPADTHAATRAVGCAATTALCASACAFTQGSACRSSKTPPGFSFILFPQSPTRNAEQGERP